MSPSGQTGGKYRAVLSVMPCCLSVCSFLSPLGLAVEGISAPLIWWTQLITAWRRNMHDEGNWGRLIKTTLQARRETETTREPRVLQKARGRRLTPDDQRLRGPPLPTALSSISSASLTAPRSTVRRLRCPASTAQRSVWGTSSILGRVSSTSVLATEEASVETVDAVEVEEEASVGEGVRTGPSQRVRLATTSASICRSVGGTRSARAVQGSKEDK